MQSDYFFGVPGGSIVFLNSGDSYVAKVENFVSQLYSIVFCNKHL
jgi:hypothetical protein